MSNPFDPLDGIIRINHMTGDVARAMPSAAQQAALNAALEGPATHLIASAASSDVAVKAATAGLAAANLGNYAALVDANLSAVATLRPDPDALQRTIDQLAGADLGGTIEQLSSSLERQLRLVNGPAESLAALARTARQPWQDLAEFPRDLTLHMKPIIESFETQQRFVEAQGSVYVLSQRYLETFDWTHAMASLSPTTEFSQLQDATAAITRSYEKLIQAVAAGDPQTLAPIVYDLPPLDVTGHADFLRVWVEPDKAHSSSEPESESEPQLLVAELRERVGSQLQPRLGLLNDGLPKMWIGARQALRSSNPDRCRHAAVSTRELVTHLIHLLAPDDDVRQWTSDPAHYDEKHRPTRRARFLYVCRGVAAEGYARFIEKIIGGTLAKIELLQKGTHQIEASLEERQIEALYLSIGADLLLLIESSNTRH